LGWLAAFLNEVEKKAANQANTNYDALIKKIRAIPCKKSEQLKYLFSKKIRSKKEVSGLTFSFEQLQ